MKDVDHDRSLVMNSSTISPMANYNGWQQIRPLGEGGQSEVFLVRSPQRAAQRNKCVEDMGLARDRARWDNFADALLLYGRADFPSELGALKLFNKTRKLGAGPQERLRSEIEILRKGLPGLPKLLDANESEMWMVTEYFSHGTLAHSHLRYKGDAKSALTAFRSLVETVATSLHIDKTVHRDIKPDNVFIADNGNLIPGDFGIVFLPNHGARPTLQHERVGPWEYMPQWADTGNRLDNVEPNIDVYMLGKLLWCMISGRLRLPREMHRDPDYDLAVMFPNEPLMAPINSILDKCLVLRAHECLPSAHELLAMVDQTISMNVRELTRNKDGSLTLPCLVCGRGHYEEEAPDTRVQVDYIAGHTVTKMSLKAYFCNVCTHRAFFAPGYPGEAAKRDWPPLSF